MAIQLNPVSEITIEHKRPSREYWLDLWRFRQLFIYLAWRDILVRYKQTYFGLAWSVARPVLSVIIFTLVFHRIAKMPSDGGPYPVLVLTALLPWQFFSNSLSDASNSLVSNAEMISKVYFPRILIPSSVMLVNLLDLLIGLALLAMILAGYRMGLSLRIFAFPVFLGLGLLVCLGISLWFSALNVQYRDIKHLLPFLIQLGMYASPVGYTSRAVPEAWQAIYVVNPMVGVIEGIRWAFFGIPWAMLPEALAWSCIWAAIFLASGIWYFRKTELFFADVI